MGKRGEIGNKNREEGKLQGRMGVEGTGDKVGGNIKGKKKNRRKLR